MLNADMLLATLLWPAIAVAVVLSLCWIPAIHKSRNASLFVCAAAICVGAGVGYWGIIGAPQWPLPVDAKARYPFIALLALLATGLSLRWPSRIPSFAIGLGLALLAQRLLLFSAIEFQWTQSQALVRVLLLAIGMLIMVSSAGHLQRELPPKLSVLVVALVSGLTAPLMVFSDSLVLAQLQGSLGIAMGLLCVATWLLPGRIFPESAHIVAMTLSWSLWTICLLFANIPTTSFVLLISALPFATLVLILTNRATPRFRHALVLTSICAALLASVVIGGFRYKNTSEAAPSSDDDSGYGYDYE